MSRVVICCEEYDFIEIFTLSYEVFRKRSWYNIIYWQKLKLGINKWQEYFYFLFMLMLVLIQPTYNWKTKSGGSGVIKFPLNKLALKKIKKFMNNKKIIVIKKKDCSPMEKH